MNKILDQPFILYFILIAAIGIPLCVFPVNLFSGEIVSQVGIAEQVVQAPLSLSYFLGFGLNVGDLDTVKTFYLLPSGKILAVALIFGLPALITYRVHIGRNKTKI